MTQYQRRITTALLSLMVLALTSQPVYAKPKMEISVSANKEIVETVNGKKVRKMVPVQQVVTGDTLTYTLSYSNEGNEAAKNAVIDNPIPKGVSYIGESATGPGSEISYSADNGKTYAQAVRLSYEIHKEGKIFKRTATPEDYTHIRWVIKEVPAGSRGTLSFMVNVK